MEMRDYKIKGFPEVHPEVFEFPNVAELLMQPTWVRADAETVLKHGSELQKYILDRTPLKNDRKYVHFSHTVTMLYPGVFNVPNKYWHGTDGEWHRDGSPNIYNTTPDRCHVMQSDCEVLTEFNEEELTLSLPASWGQEELVIMINSNPAAVGVKARKMPPNQFVSFTDHLHRVVDATHHQFRYFVRVIESNNYQPELYPESLRDRLTVGVAGIPNSGVANITKFPEERRVVIHY